MEKPTRAASSPFHALSSPGTRHIVGTIFIASRQRGGPSVRDFDAAFRLGGHQQNRPRRRRLCRDLGRRLDTGRCPARPGRGMSREGVTLDCLPRTEPRPQTTPVVRRPGPPKGNTVRKTMIKELGAKAEAFSGIAISAPSDANTSTSEALHPVLRVFGQGAHLRLAPGAERAIEMGRDRVDDHSCRIDIAHPR